MKPEQIEELVQKILYARLKTPWDGIKNHCLCDAEGEIDNAWANSLDEEQCLRMDIAAFLKEYLSKLSCYPEVVTGETHDQDEHDLPHPEG